MAPSEVWRTRPEGHASLPERLWGARLRPPPQDDGPLTYEFCMSFVAYLSLALLFLATLIAIAHIVQESKKGMALAATVKLAWHLARSKKRVSAGALGKRFAILASTLRFQNEKRNSRKLA